MRMIQKVRRIFLALPSGEKFLVTALSILCIVSLGNFFIENFALPIADEKGAFSEGIVGKFRAINPVFADLNEADRDAVQLIFSGLLRYDPVAKNFLPDLALSWDRTSNGLVYSLKIRTDAVWHDGVPVTADDIIFTYRNVISDPAFRNPILKNTFDGVKIEKPEADKIVFKLPRSNSFFISNLTLGVLPAHLLEDIPVDTWETADFVRHPVGSGPYRVNSLKLASNGDFLDLKTFDKYYGNKPAIPHIRLYTFPTEKDLLNEKKALNGLNRIKSENFKDDENSFNLNEYSLNQFTALFFNTDNVLLNDKNFRLALSQAVNKDELIAKDEKRIDAIDIKEYKDNPIFDYKKTEESSTKLTELGFKLDGNGVLKTAKDEPVSFRLLYFSKIGKEIPARIAYYWKKLGIQVNLDEQESEKFSQLVNERKYDMVIIKENLGHNRDMYSLFNSSQAIQNKETTDEKQVLPGLNFANFRSFKTDGLTEALRKEQDGKAKNNLFAQLIKIISEESPVIFISTPVYSYALDKRLEAFPNANMDFHSDRMLITPYLTTKL